MRASSALLLVRQYPGVPWNFPILYTFYHVLASRNILLTTYSLLVVQTKTSNTAQPLQTNTIPRFLHRQSSLPIYLSIALLLALLHTSAAIPDFTDSTAHICPTIYLSIHLSIDLFTAPPSNLLSSNKESSC